MAGCVGGWVGQWVGLGQMTNNLINLDLIKIEMVFLKRHSGYTDIAKCTTP